MSYPEKDLITEWDTCDISKRYVEQAMEDEGYTEEEAQAYIDGYQAPFEDEWDWMCDDITIAMQEWGNDSMSWYCEVNNFGWRSLDGEKYFRAKDGHQLLQEVLPKTDCTFKVYKWSRGRGSTPGIKIQNWHHDALTGEEVYFIRKMLQSEAEEANL